MEIYPLNLSRAELQVINEALMRMPYRDAAPVVESINHQLIAAEDNLKKNEPPPNKE